jgi:CRP/FNR family transcriptional regulator, cyclic AMP receptor protein
MSAHKPSTECLPKNQDSRVHPNPNNKGYRSVDAADVPDILLDSNQVEQAFCNLKGETGARFNAMGVKIGYSRGAMCFAEGELPQRVLVLHNGRIKLFVTTREGKTMIVRIVGAGQVLGLSAALTGNPYEASAEALEPCTLLAIRRNDFLYFLEQYPDAAKAATRCILKEYEIVFRYICRLGLPSTVAGRLANLLLDWMKRDGQAGQVKGRLTMGLTHEDIAAMTGTSRETVSRILQQFQREKLISVKGSLVTVLRPAALERLAA